MLFSRFLFKESRLRPCRWPLSTLSLALPRTPLREPRRDACPGIRSGRKQPREGNALADAFSMLLSFPLRRRRRITSRPPLVLIRTRKPWVLARLRFFGWYVRFIGRGSIRPRYTLCLARNRLRTFLRDLRMTEPPGAGAVVWSATRLQSVF